jgi:hypothetical protein
MNMGRIKLNRKKQKKGIDSLKALYHNKGDLKPIFAGAAISGFFCNLL